MRYLSIAFLLEKNMTTEDITQTTPNVAQAITSSLSSSIDLSIEDTSILINQFDAIGEQAQLFQGKILLEIQNRCYQNSKSLKALLEELGMENSTLLLISPAQRNRLINLAAFFTQHRPMTGISVTVGYEISAPRNEKIADQLYQAAVGKSITVQEIQVLIDTFKDKSRKKLETFKPTVSSSKRITMTKDAIEIRKFIRSVNMDDKRAITALYTCYLKMLEELNRPPVTA